MDSIEPAKVQKTITGHTLASYIHSMASETTEASAVVSDDSESPTVILTIGMAGSGKTTFMQRLNADLHMQKKNPYLINLDPAVFELPFTPNIDIRDTVKYKEVMKQYKLGPNGAIMTSLNLFATKFDKVLELVKNRVESGTRNIIVDTPGQIEVFTWSASGTIITESLAALFPTVVAYVLDTPRCRTPATFMSNMLYACSIMYKTKLPFILVFNKTDIEDHGFVVEWMQNFEAFQEAVAQDESYMGSMVQSMGLVLEEFYNNLRIVGVSSFTGDGMGDFFDAVKEAVKEYEADFKPSFEAALRARQEQESSRQENHLEKFMNDLALEKKETTTEDDYEDEDDEN